MTLEPNYIIHERYQIVKLLGQGGMGAVYQAFDTLYDRPCAIKEFCLGHLPQEEVLNKQNASLPAERQKKGILTREKAARQFKREAKLMASLDHPNLPKVTDYFAYGGEYYLVMTLIVGQDLALMLEEKKWQPFPEAHVIEWMNQIIDAVGYCHQNKVVHRDIKPANIIVTTTNKVFLVDFGIAKQTSSDGTTGIMQVLTPKYSPPEQYTGAGQTDERSDIYSLGATMYSLITGQEPIEAISRATGEILAPPKSIVPDITTATNAAIMKAMELLPKNRFQKAAELQSAIVKAANPENADPEDDKPTGSLRAVGAVLQLMKASIPHPIIETQTESIRVIPLLRSKTLLGRASTQKGHAVDIDLTHLDDKRIISRHHASIICQSKKYYVSDNNSRNGTWLNGEKLIPEQLYPLSDGDLIQLGSLKPRGIKAVFKHENE